MKLIIMGIVGTASQAAASRLSFGDPFTVCRTGGHKTRPYPNFYAGGDTADYRLVSHSHPNFYAGGGTADYRVAVDATRRE